MLQYQTVEPATLGLLKRIQDLPIFSSHRLVGGTSLALQFGHRLSIDLDFFSENLIEHQEILINIKPLGKVDIVSNPNISVVFILMTSRLISCHFHTNG